MSTLAALPKLDGSIPAQAQLVPGEVLLASQPGVGLYDGGTKSPAHQAGSAHVTSHRLLYLDDAQPETCSLALNLSTVAQSDYYAGFLTSSSKVELVLHSDSADEEPDEQWTCPICSQDNQPSLGARRTTCSLCGASRPPTASKPAPANELQCAACTFINEPGSTKCDICDSPLPVRSSAQRPLVPERQTIKISFRKGGDKQFYAALKRALQAKAWKTPDPSSVGRSTPAPQHGISGIMNAVETNATQSTDTVASALRDLEALAAQAKSMVALASNLSAKLQQSQQQSKLSAADAEASSFIQKSLYNMGLALPDGPVMQDSLNDEKKWTDELAGEVAGLLREGLMGGRGMVGLDEIWCAWNRARGVALLAPETFLAALTRAIEKQQVALALRTLRSGLIVLHAPRLSHAAFCARLAQDPPLPAPPSTATTTTYADGAEMSALRGEGEDDVADARQPESDSGQRWHTPLDVAAREEIAVALATMLLEAAEDDGLLWRDVEPFGGVRWTRNVLKDWTWDGSD